MKELKDVNLESTLRCFSLKESTSLAKKLSVRLRTKWLWVRVPLQSESTCVKSNGNVYMNLYRLAS